MYIYINVRLLTMSKDSIFNTTDYKHVSVKFYLYALLLLFCNCLLLAGCDCCGCCSFVDCGCFSSCFDECWSNNETNDNAENSGCCSWIGGILSRFNFWNNNNNNNQNPGVNNNNLNNQNKNNQNPGVNNNNLNNQNNNNQNPGWNNNNLNNHIGNDEKKEDDRIKKEKEEKIQKEKEEKIQKEKEDDRIKKEKEEKIQKEKEEKIQKENEEKERKRKEKEAKRKSEEKERKRKEKNKIPYKEQGKENLVDITTEVKKIFDHMSNNQNLGKEEEKEEIIQGYLSDILKIAIKLVGKLEDQLSKTFQNFYENLIQYNKLIQQHNDELRNFIKANNYSHPKNCKICKKMIKGILFKCSICTDYYICNKCAEKDYCFYNKHMHDFILLFGDQMKTKKILCINEDDNEILEGHHNINEKLDKYNKKANKVEDNNERQNNYSNFNFEKEYLFKLSFLIRLWLYISSLRKKIQNNNFNQYVNNQNNNFDQYVDNYASKMYRKKSINDIATDDNNKRKELKDRNNIFKYYNQEKTKSTTYEDTIINKTDELEENFIKQIAYIITQIGKEYQNIFKQKNERFQNYIKKIKNNMDDINKQIQEENEKYKGKEHEEICQICNQKIKGFLYQSCIDEKYYICAQCLFYKHNLYNEKGHYFKRLTRSWKKKSLENYMTYMTMDEQNTTMDEQNTTMDEQNTTMDEQNTTMNEQNTTMDEQKNIKRTKKMGQKCTQTVGYKKGYRKTETEPENET